MSLLPSQALILTIYVKCCAIFFSFTVLILLFSAQKAVEVVKLGWELDLEIEEERAF